MESQDQQVRYLRLYATNNAVNGEIRLILTKYIPDANRSSEDRPRPGRPAKNVNKRTA